MVFRVYRTAIHCGTLVLLYAAVSTTMFYLSVYLLNYLSVYLVNYSILKKTAKSDIYKSVLCPVTNTKNENLCIKSRFHMLTTPQPPPPLPIRIRITNNYEPNFL